MPLCVILLAHIITSALLHQLLLLYIHLNLRTYVHRTLVVMALLAQMPRMMCARCVEGMGACVDWARTSLKRTWLILVRFHTLEAQSLTSVACRQDCSAVNTCDSLLEDVDAQCTVVCVSEYNYVRRGSTIQYCIRSHQIMIVDSFMWTPLSHVAGYHDGFTIPAGATSILITEEPVNPIVFLGECIRIWWVYICCQGQAVSIQKGLPKGRPSPFATSCMPVCVHIHCNMLGW